MLSTTRPHQQVFRCSSMSLMFLFASWIFYTFFIVFFFLNFCSLHRRFVVFTFFEKFYFSFCLVFWFPQCVRLLLLGVSILLYSVVSLEQEQELLALWQVFCCLYFWHDLWCWKEKSSTVLIVQFCNCGLGSIVSPSIKIRGENTKNKNK